MHGISSQMFDEFFFFISGSAAVGVSPLESADCELLKARFRRSAEELERGVLFSEIGIGRAFSCAACCPAYGVLRISYATKRENGVL